MPSTLPARFDPEEVAAFRFLDHDLDRRSGRVVLRYALDELTFEEQIELPVPPAGRGADDAAIAGALRLLHLLAGVSYFKAADPPAVEAAEEDAATTALLAGIYGPGLAEFRATNGLPVDRSPWPMLQKVSDTFCSTADVRAPLVPIGGGKDSLVTVEALRAAGLPITLFSVGDAVPIAATAAASGLPRLIARRTIDPRLIELNDRGARNGHVPVTAIVSLIAVLTALLHGHDAVVMSNERSARRGSLVLDGVEVNHQWSKGADAEALLRDALGAAGAGGVFYGSLLRGASELGIARAFARHCWELYAGSFTSCNRLFTIDPAKRATSWCRNCPKCRFVFLALAPFVPRDELVAAFGGDVLDDPAQIDGVAALLGRGAAKPYECVGEVEESAAALAAIADRPEWKDRAVVRALAPVPEAPPLEAVLALEPTPWLPPGLASAAARALT